MSKQGVALFADVLRKSLRDPFFARTLSNTKSNQQFAVLEHFETEGKIRNDAEWVNAKEYKEIPGPSTFELIKAYMPGGPLHNAGILDMEEYFHERYGDILIIRGNRLIGKPDIIFNKNVADFETVFRNEGVWPLRTGLETLDHYRSNVRPDIFQGTVGLVSSQGRAWGEIRNKVNPVMMKVQTIRQNLPMINEIAVEFLERFDKLIDPQSGQIKGDIVEETKMWAFESIAFIAFHTRLGLLSRDTMHPQAKKLVDSLSLFLAEIYKYDIEPSIWRFYETKGFKQFLKTNDNITEVASYFIEKAMEKFSNEPNREAKSVLEKLYKIDKKVATVMATDMMMAGMDTTSSVLMSTLYYLGVNPEKQEILRQEVNRILPEPDSELTDEKTKNMPYLRACLKEVLRFKPIATASLRLTGRDLVLSGYKVPRGVAIYMTTMRLANSEQYFERSKEFLPERWLKKEKSACPAMKKHNPFAYLPFGYGPRTCIGKRIADMELEVIVTRLIRNYRVSWTGEQPMKYFSGLILSPTGEMHFKFEKI